MKKIEYSLEVEDQSVTLTVYSQLSTINKYLIGGAYRYKATNGIAIMAIDSVELISSRNEVFLRGDTSPNGEDSHKVKLNSNREAIAFAARVHDAIEEWVKDWHMWPQAIKDELESVSDASEGKEIIRYDVMPNEIASAEQK